MAEGMNFNHCGHHIAGDKRITHPRSGLHDTIANIADCENRRFASRFKDSVVYLGD